MAITQKKVKEEIENAEKLIAETVREKNEIMLKIKKAMDESKKIDTSTDEEVKQDLDEYNGLMTTINYYTGHLNALHWVLQEMKPKPKTKAKTEAKEGKEDK